MSDVYQALSSPVRRQILGLLKERDLSAGEIAEQVNVSKSTLSGHFNILKNANLVVAIKDGTTITYSINTSVVEDLLSNLFDFLGKPGSLSEQEGK